MQKGLVRITREMSYNDSNFTHRSHVSVHKCPAYRELEDVSDNEMSVWDAIEQDDGTDDLMGHLLDDWVEAEIQEEMEADGQL